MADVVTIHRHIMQRQRLNPEATGELSMLLSTMALATKLISRHVNKAGLLDILGKTGGTNIQGEQVARLDELSNQIIKDSFLYTGLLAGLASEEEDDVVPMPPEVPRGRYVLLFDPLDGSSNIDANVSTGTIFSIYKKVSPGTDPHREDFLQPGRKLVASGYAAYGSSTMLVYTTGERVDGFTLDPEVGEFLLSHPDIRIPDKCSVFSANEAWRNKWPEPARIFADFIRSSTEERYVNTTNRYVGSLVSDFHRNLVYGGVFLYPEYTDFPKGKLRLMYEAIPLAFIAEAAGGRASTGTQRIIDMQPLEIHQRVPFVVGNAQEVKMYESLVQADRKTP
ncbi:MAG: fructose-1,6-bisphosphatase I [Myxococcota bacterium]|jgi:fructose-1,6-bisphosphatase I